MNQRNPDISTAVFEALASGGGGPDAIRELAAQRYRKHVTLLRGVLAAAQSGSAVTERRARQAYDLLAAVEHRYPKTAERIILYPAVGAWALRVVQAYRSGASFSAADPGRLAAVAAAAAIRAGFAAEIEMAASGGIVTLPSLGTADVGGSTAVVRHTADGTEVFSADRRVVMPARPDRDARGWRGLRRFQAGSFDVLVDDLDPFRMPSSPDLSTRLSAAEADRMRAALKSGWLVLEEFHSTVAAEVVEAIRVVVPLINTRGGQKGSTSSATFGAIGLSEPPDPYWCAVTFAHEIQHLKLSALLESVPLTLPDNGQRFYAPWRDDPRPISGLLQGAYAFLGVTGFWRRQRQSADGSLRLRTDSEFARWREACGQVIGTLRSSGRLTGAGKDFVRGMAGTLDAWRDEPVAREALDRARREAARHVATWQVAHGPLPA
jgi:HEXXH motif-containing protein